MFISFRNQIKPGCTGKKSFYEEQPKVSLKEMCETKMARNSFSVCKIKSSLSETESETGNMILFYISIIQDFFSSLLRDSMFCEMFFVSPIGGFLENLAGN